MPTHQNPLQTSIGSVDPRAPVFEPYGVTFCLHRALKQHRSSLRRREGEEGGMATA